MKNDKKFIIVKPSLWRADCFYYLSLDQVLGYSFISHGEEKGIFNLTYFSDKKTPEIAEYVYMPGSYKAKSIKEFKAKTPYDIVKMLEDGGYVFFLN